MRLARDPEDLACMQAAAAAVPGVQVIKKLHTDISLRAAEDAARAYGRFCQPDDAEVRTLFTDCARAALGVGGAVLSLIGTSSQLQEVNIRYDSLVYSLTHERDA